MAKSAKSDTVEMKLCLLSQFILSSTWKEGVRNKTSECWSGWKKMSGVHSLFSRSLSSEAVVDVSRSNYPHVHPLQLRDSNKWSVCELSEGITSVELSSMSFTLCCREGTSSLPVSSPFCSMICNCSAYLLHPTHLNHIGNTLSCNRRRIFCFCFNFWCNASSISFSSINQTIALEGTSWRMTCGVVVGIGVWTGLVVIPHIPPLGLRNLVDRIQHTESITDTSSDIHRERKWLRFNLVHDFSRNFRRCHILSALHTVHHELGVFLNSSNFTLSLLRTSLRGRSI